MCRYGPCLDGNLYPWGHRASLEHRRLARASQQRLPASNYQPHNQFNDLPTSTRRRLCDGKVKCNREFKNIDWYFMKRAEPQPYGPVSFDNLQKYYLASGMPVNNQTKVWHHNI